MSDTPADKPLLTIRIYRVTSNGTRVEQRPTVHITPDTAGDPYSNGCAWPPCQCPRCR